MLEETFIVEFKSGERVIHYPIKNGYIVDVRNIHNVAVTGSLYDGLMTLSARFRTLATELENLAQANK